MALSALIIAWLDRLASRSVLPGVAYLELGPQVVSAPSRLVGDFLRRRSGSDQVGDTLAGIYGEPRMPRPQTVIYRALGMTDYVSVDLSDRRADVIHDLNEPLDLGRRFQVVTNFGTAEHIFNIATCLQTQYRHLAVGGVALHVLPTFSDVNHGFYNIHPTLVRDLAAANAMEIVDFQYVDDVTGRNDRMGASGSCAFDWSALPIKPAADQAPNFNLVVAWHFLRNSNGHMKPTFPR